ncbi:18331_t:CDS:2 [Entrophospora sp. SA101]|nr:18331_t:CDS:2 [Entrophospora sp. SA101]
MISESIPSSGHGHIVTKAVGEKNTTIDTDISMNSSTKTIPDCNNTNNQDQKSQQNQTFDSKITTATAVVNTCDDADVKKKLIENDYYDVIIKVSDNDDCIDGGDDEKVGRESNNLKSGNVYEIDKSHISSKIFEIVFNYISYGVINFNSVLTGTEFLDLWLCSREFMLEGIERQIKEVFETKSLKLEKHFISILLKIMENEELKGEFLYNCVEIINTTNWIFQGNLPLSSLDENFINKLLINDGNYFINDGIIWKILIKWANVKEIDINNKIDVKTWTSKDLDDLKIKIGKFLALIKFSLISRNDYYDYVLPFKEILPADTTNNAALQYYLYCSNENGQPKPDVLRPNVILEDSKIINHTHVAMIARWIDTGKELFNYTNNHNNLEELHLPSPVMAATTTADTGSKDGFNIKSYNEKCSDRGPTIIITKISNKRILIGGYYPININSTTTNTCPISVFTGSLEAFIFSFGDNDNPEYDGIISRVLKDHSHQSICKTINGPGFGLYSTTNSADEFEYGIDFSKTLVQSINVDENDRENDIQPIPLRYINDKELLSPIVDIDPRSTVKIAIIKPSLSKIKDYDIDEKTNHLKDTLESTLQLEYVIVIPIDYFLKEEDKEEEDENDINAIIFDSSILYNDTIKNLAVKAKNGNLRIIALTKLLELFSVNDIFEKNSNQYYSPSLK